VVSKSERVELETKILKYRSFLRFIEDEKFREIAKAVIAELEGKLRTIDE
jgi:hypothetical protein